MIAKGNEKAMGKEPAKKENPALNRLLHQIRFVDHFHPLIMIASNLSIPITPFRLNARTHHSERKCQRKFKEKPSHCERRSHRSARERNATMENKGIGLCEVVQANKAMPVLISMTEP